MVCSMQREQICLYVVCDLELQFYLDGAINQKWRKNSEKLKERKTYAQN